MQSFNTDLFRLFGQISWDPDFDLLRVTAGTNFSLASPGHTTLTQAGGEWGVDSSGATIPNASACPTPP